MSPAHADAPESCSSSLERLAMRLVRQVTVVGRTPVEVTLDAPGDHEILVVARERGIDVALELVSGSGTILRADNPVRRAGDRRVIAERGHSATLMARIVGKEHADSTGQVAIRSYDLGGLPPDGSCLKALRALAAGDADYARGQDVSLRRSSAGPVAARHTYLRAVEEYQLAYRTLDSAGDAPMRVDAALPVAATYYQDLKDWARTAEWASIAASLAETERLEYPAARGRALLAAAWIESAPQAEAGEHSTATPTSTRVTLERARTSLRELERLHRRRGESYDAALQLNNVGLAYIHEGRFTDAEPIFRRVIDELGVLHEWPRQGLALQNLAFCEWGRDNVTVAARTFAQAVKKLGPEPFPNLYLLALANSALLNYSIGAFDAALKLDAEALSLARTVQAPLYEGQSLYGLGVTYYALGEVELARQYLEESLVIRRPDLDPRGRVASLRALGTLYHEAGRFEEATRVDEEALALASIPPMRARILIRLATDRLAAGQPDHARQLLDKVLSEERQDSGVRAQALLARAQIERATGDYSLARRDLAAALKLLDPQADLEDAFRLELELARTLRAMREPRAALEAVNRALSHSDTLRRQTSNPGFRAQRQEPLRPAYDLKVALLAEEYARLDPSRNAAAAERISLQALETAERHRAQSLSDLSSLSFTPKTLGRISGQLARREELYRNIAAQRFLLDEREDVAGARDVRTHALRIRIATLRGELDTLNSEIARSTGLRASTQIWSARRWPALLRDLDQDVVLVDYWLGDGEAYAWTVARSGVRWYDLGASRPIIEAARALHAALRGYASRPLEERLEAGALLYDRILRPLGEMADLRQPLIVVPDRALDVVPFAALRTGHANAGSFLVQQRDVAVTPAAWWLFTHRERAAQRAAPPRRVLVVSDPVYALDDERMTGSAVRSGGPGAPSVATTSAGQQATQGDPRRLPWTAREAAMIGALVPASLVDHLEGTNATRARLLDRDWSGYRIIHLAAHGRIDTSMPQLSALILGAYDERGNRVEQEVRAADLEQLTLRADLLTLSACDTALGKDIAGEGALGLANTAIARGARAVLASLWQAPDEMSSQLMTEFYGGLLREKLNPTSALGSAMRAVLARHPRADPAFWAAFQLSVSQPADSRKVVDVTVAN